MISAEAESPFNSYQLILFHVVWALWAPKPEELIVTKGERLLLRTLIIHNVGLWGMNRCLQHNFNNNLSQRMSLLQQGGNSLYTFSAIMCYIRRYCLETSRLLFRTCESGSASNGKIFYQQSQGLYNVVAKIECRQAQELDHAPSSQTS